MTVPPISGIGPAPAITPAPPSSAADASSGATFGDALKQLLGPVEQSQGVANQAIGQMLDGTGDVHEAVIAMQKADTMFQLTVQIRNKLVQAYEDVMRMSI
jgi:flagellar hook-basal body complex protein FliE